MKINKLLSKIDPLVLSDYILMKYGTMSHLKLQKLLFYCDAYHLACFDTSLIDEDFEAWVHGPVLREVYKILNDDSQMYAEVSFDKDEDTIQTLFSNLTCDQQELVIDVLESLKNWSEFQLEIAIHREQPWMEARRGYEPSEKCTVKISKETTRIYYRSELNG